MEGLSLVSFLSREVMRKGMYLHLLLIIVMPALLSLSIYLQGGDGEFSWLGPHLSSILAIPKVGMWDIGQPLLMSLTEDFRQNPNVLSPIFKKHSILLLSICPCPVGISCPHFP
jgi:hypothetical protein